jgi:hypothetical protein
VQHGNALRWISRSCEKKYKTTALDLLFALLVAALDLPILRKKIQINI